MHVVYCFTLFSRSAHSAGPVSVLLIGWWLVWLVGGLVGWLGGCWRAGWLAGWFAQIWFREPSSHTTPIPQKQGGTLANFFLKISASGNAGT